MTILKTTLVLAALASPLSAQDEVNLDEQRVNLASMIVMKGFDCAQIDGNVAATDVAGIFLVECKTTSGSSSWYQLDTNEPSDIGVQPAQQAQ